MARIAAISTLVFVASMVATHNDESQVSTGAHAAATPVELGAAATVNRVSSLEPPVGRAAPSLAAAIDEITVDADLAERMRELYAIAEETLGPVDLFKEGYRDGGGTNTNAILAIAKCESGLTDPEIDNAGLNRNGTVDWGFLQINDGVWDDRFEQVTGKDFDTYVLTPYWNGYMGAHIEQVQGWSAWSASRHCHGVA